MSDLTREQIDELFERSKDDRAIIVGSEVRQLASMALRSLSLREQIIEECARVCESYMLEQRDIGRSSKNGDHAIAAFGALECARAIRALSAQPQKEAQTMNERILEDARVSRKQFYETHKAVMDEIAAERAQTRHEDSASAISGGPDRASGDTQAMRDVAAERARQINAEGWTPAHDDEHTDRELARAALSYAQHYVERAWIAEEAANGHDFDSKYDEDEAPDEWPWSPRWWKPKNPRRDLVKATALLLAEIERIDRATAPGIGYELQTASEPNDNAAVAASRSPEAHD